MRWAWAATVCMACTSGTPTPEDSDPPVIIEGPEIEHTAPVPPFLEGEAIPFMAEATDPDGVEGMELFYRTEGDLPYQLVIMEQVEEGFVAEVPGDSVNAPALEYFLRATDASEFRVQSTDPAAGAEGPDTLFVSVVPTEVPYSQNFDGTTSLFGIYEVNWVEYPLAFRGQRWELQEEAGLDGSGAAVHPGGFQDSDAVDDWLVTPTLNFLPLETAEVRWAEFGVDVDRATHSLWVSTGSANPEDGDFEKVLDLAPPLEGAWRRAPVVDLTPYAGQTAVTLAWRFEGQDADEWRIDDVQIRAFGPDLQLVEVESERVEPGDTVGLTVTLQNIGAPTAGPVQLTGLALDPAASFGDGAELGPLGTGQSATGVLPLEVGEDALDNATLPIELMATDGVDAFSWTSDVLVGDPTTGLVRLQTGGPGLVQLWMGTGNPVQPTVEEPVFLGTLPANVHSFQVDLAEHIAHLPAEEGRLRWWIRVNTEAPSSLLGFGIDFDGAVAWTDTNGPFPPGVDTYIYLPGRANPVVESVVLDPDPLVPGQPGIVAVTLTNQGSFTTGATEARLTADSALALQVDTLPISAGPWDPSGTVTLEVPVTVAASHTDSSPLALNLTVWDPLEFYPLDTVVVPVPWPDLVVGIPVVVDPTGNGNGLLDPGEAADLVVDVRNDGALDTGEVVCTLSQQSGPILTLLNAASTVGSLAPGSANTASFSIEANGGVAGDDLALTVTCEDGVLSEVQSVDLVLGERGWTTLPLDPSEDALDDAFDIREIRWRVDTDALEIEIRSIVPLDFSTLAFELWMDNVGSIWQQHVVTVQNGQPNLWGLQSGGFNPLDDPDLVMVDGDTVRVRMVLADMELGEDALQLAVGTGFCAVPELYCDHAPDGWGNPYADPFDSTLWYTLDW